MYHKLKLKLEDAVSYEEYRHLIKGLLERDTTSGHNPTEHLVEITELNEKRMDRLEKTIELSDDLKQLIASLKKQYIFLVISEAWCADSAQSLPIIQKMAEISPNIDLKIVFRDEHPDLMEEYLTNGSRSIPKLIAIEACDFRELGVWGPRPEYLQHRLREYQQTPDKSKEEFQKEMQLWYAKDKGRHLQNDFMQLFNHWESRVGVPCE